MPKKHNYSRRNWTEDERKILNEMYANNYTDTICKLLNRKYGSVSAQAYLMGLKKSEEFKKMELAKQGTRLKISGDAHRFHKGNTPYNKGKRMPADLYEKCKQTMFKKGRLPHNTKNDWEETLHTDQRGVQYWMIKLPSVRKQKPKHIWLWETANGNLKKGFNIVFKDRNTLNCILENLECLSNSELMIRNTIHRYPIELKSTILLVKKLKRAIHAKE